MSTHVLFNLFNKFRLATPPPPWPPSRPLSLAVGFPVLIFPDDQNKPVGARGRIIKRHSIHVSSSVFSYFVIKYSHFKRCFEDVKSAQHF